MNVIASGIWILIILPLAGLARAGVDPLGGEVAAIKRIAPGEFPRLPAHVVKGLTQMDCTIAGNRTNSSNLRKAGRMSFPAALRGAGRLTTRCCVFERNGVSQDSDVLGRTKPLCIRVKCRCGYQLFAGKAPAASREHLVIQGNYACLATHHRALSCKLYGRAQLARHDARRH